MRSMQARAARVALSAMLVVLVTSVATPVHAQKADYIPDEVVKKKKKKRKKQFRDGWHPRLKAGFSFAFNQSQGVVGVADGITIALGLQIDGGLMFRKGGHEWVSQLNIVHAQTKMPNIDPFLKAADQFQLSSYYQYRFRPKYKWIGVFGGLRVTTALLPGSLVVPEDKALAITELDGAVTPDLALGQKSYRLTDAFAPVMFKQFLGALFKPLERTWLTVDIKLGIGANEVWVSQGLAAKDDKATADVLELVRMQNYLEAGLELQVGLVGSAFKKLLTYGLLAEVLVPFAEKTEVPSDLSRAELISSAFKLTVGIKLFKWLALNYTLAVQRYPLIVDEWQVQGSLVLAVQANIVK